MSSVVWILCNQRHFELEASVKRKTATSFVPKLPLEVELILKPKCCYLLLEGNYAAPLDL